MKNILTWIYFQIYNATFSCVDMHIFSITLSFNLSQITVVFMLFKSRIRSIYLSHLSQMDVYFLWCYVMSFVTNNQSSALDQTSYCLFNILISLNIWWFFTTIYWYNSLSLFSNAAKHDTIHHYFFDLLLDISIYLIYVK